MKIPFSRLVVGGLLTAVGLCLHRWALAQTAAPQVETAPSRMSLTLAPVGGVYGLFERPAVGGAPVALQVKARGAAPGALVTLQARDLCKPKSASCRRTASAFGPIRFSPPIRRDSSAATICVCCKRWASRCSAPTSTRAS